MKRVDQQKQQESYMRKMEIHLITLVELRLL